jgi:myo-inositol-1(or 4)-monophosphatase
LIRTMDADKIDVSLLEEIEAHAVAIARGAGQILLEHFSKPLEVQFKGKNNQDPVTVADGRSEAFLKTAIKEKFPKHNILGEEGGALSESDSPFIWVLDPLDGTSNYMNGLPLFAVSVGVLWQGRPVVGCIFVPVSHRAAPGVYHARLGNGAFLNGEKITAARTPSGRPLAEMPPGFSGGFRLSGRSRKSPHETRNLGSIAVELALTACGVFQYALFGAPKIWDIAAGVVLVKEAGGLAFTRPKRGGKWLPLACFQPEGKDDSKALEKLRGWSAPLVVGAPEAARQVVKDIRRFHSPLARLSNLLRPLNRKNGIAKQGARTPHE